MLCVLAYIRNSQFLKGKKLMSYLFYAEHHAQFYGEKEQDKTNWGFKKCMV